MNATVKTKGNEGNASVGATPDFQFGIAGRRGAGVIEPRGAAIADGGNPEAFSIFMVRDAAKTIVEGVEKGTIQMDEFRKTVDEMTTAATHATKSRDAIVQVMVEEVRRPIARMANSSMDAREFYKIINDAVAQLMSFKPDISYTGA